MIGVILAAGEGNRLRPFTEDMPKVFIDPRSTATREIKPNAKVM